MDSIAKRKAQTACTKIPNSVLLSNISFGAKVVFALLIMFAKQTNRSPSQKQLAKAANCSEKTVRIYLNELRDAGFLNWKQCGLTQTNVYFPNLRR